MEGGWRELLRGARDEMRDAKDEMRDAKDEMRDAKDELRDYILLTQQHCTIGNLLALLCIKKTLV
ncbi:hypothetical protein CWC28_00515 [Pseudoalteromonas sp. S4492]|nr:hypothetical protein CWC28_00515 [Pseudoalteromonas sp. S4492]